ncbi:MAG: PhzF family phenazine biosynthesis protein [Pseudomonadota bacterium]
MAKHAFDWVDAFTDRPFGGNACMVVHAAEAVPVETRTRLVRETSLSECAYLVPSEVADFGVRYYLAEREIPMAGHPTIATVTSLFHRGLVGEGRFTLEVGAGVMPIEIGPGGRIAMTQAAPVFGDSHSPGDIAAIYGLSAEEILGTPQTVSTGTPFCITVLRDHAALRRARLDVAALEAFRARDSHPLAGIMEPFLVTLQGATAAGDTFSRLLLCPPMPAEDPFTGSATGCMAAYLWHHGLIENPSFTAEQGHDMGRPGVAKVDVLGPRDSITGIRVAGTGVVLMSGEVEL